MRDTKVTAVDGGERDDIEFLARLQSYPEGIKFRKSDEAFWDIAFNATLIGALPTPWANGEGEK